MKAPKRDYFDPKLKGKSDGKGMENLPRIIAPPVLKTSQRVSPIPTLVAQNSRRSTPHLEADQGKLTKQPTKQSTSQSTSRLVNQLADWSTNPSIDRSTILGRPKAFYITQKQDEDLDKAVEKLSRKMGEKINQKIDRSTIIRLLLEDIDITSDRTVDRLASRLVGRLISRLTS